ncbi:hypothetical protein BDW42DRAFT_95519 [Aspergillus taichungensis]|uniref:Uncharacterized protein n=1 Tax=Aspergillus taichungensis TaxID=482145 RepID=A0A2J5HW25_9EURO|nr:hypothetical protein BDW42DRAFT_95519 [Aspergillus taichungensis]
MDPLPQPGPGTGRTLPWSTFYLAVPVFHNPIITPMTRRFRTLPRAEIRTVFLWFRMEKQLLSPPLPPLNSGPASLMPADKVLASDHPMPRTRASRFVVWAKGVWSVARRTQPW